MTDKIEDAYIIDELKSYASDLQQAGSVCSSFFSGFILSDEELKKDVLKNVLILLSGQKFPLPTLSSFSFFDAVLYAYLLPFMDKAKTAEDALSWYQKKRYGRRTYYKNNISSTSSGESFCASISVDAYVSENWNVLRAIFKEPSDAVSSLLDRVENEWASAQTAADGTYLIDFPLLPALSVAKKRAFYLNDLGCELFEYICSHPKEKENSMAIPDSFIHSTIGIGSTIVEAEPVYDKESGIIQFVSEKYHTIFDVLAESDKLSEAEVEEQLSIFREQKKEFRNITTDDFSHYVDIYNLIISLKEEKFLSTTVGELTDLLYELKGNDLALKHKKRCMIEVLVSLRKWDQYALQYNTVFSNIHFLIVDIGFRSDSTALMVAGAGRQLSLDEFESYCASLSAKELESLPVRIEIPQILLADIENFRLDKQFESVYSMLRTSHARWIYTFLYKLRKAEKNCTVLHVKYSEFKKAGKIEMRKVRFQQILHASLDEIVQCSGLDSYHYESLVSTYVLQFPA